MNFGPSFRCGSHFCNYGTRANLVPSTCGTCDCEDGTVGTAPVSKSQRGLLGAGRTNRTNLASGTLVPVSRFDCNLPNQYQWSPRSDLCSAHGIVWLRMPQGAPFSDQFSALSKRRANGSHPHVQTELLPLQFCHLLEDSSGCCVTKLLHWDQSI